MANTATVEPTSTPDNYTPPPRGGRYENVLVAMLSATFGLVFFDRLALNFLAPYFSQELGLSNADIGLLGGLPALTWALSGYIVGYLSERTDRRKPILIGAILVFTLFSAFSGLVGGLASLLLFRAIMGAAEGAILPVGQPMVMYTSTPSRRGLNMGLVQSSSAGLLGGVVGPIVTVAIAESHGWRTAFLVSIIPGLIMAAVVLWKMKELRLLHPATIAADDNVAPEQGAGDTSMTLGQALKNRNIIICLIVAVFYLTWFITSQIFVPVYLAEVKKFTGGQLSFVLTGLGLAWVIWGAIVPGISDKIGRKAAILIFTAIAAVAPLLVLWINTPGLLFAGLVLTYTGLGTFAIWMATIPAETLPRHLMPRILALIMGLGEIAGGFIAPWIAGALADSYGLDITMYFSATAAVIVFVLCLGLKETAPSRVAKAGAAA